MSKCILSIIIPVYNVENYLKECINSLICQIREGCEVILVDDGSTDSSGIMCDDICGNNLNFVVVHKNNGGLSDARNEGIKHSNGNYIMFLDSDDMLSPNAIDVIYENIYAHNSDVLFGRAKAFGENGDVVKYNIDSYKKYQNIIEPGRLLVELDKNPKFWFAAWLIIIRREFLLDNSLFFEKGILHEDERWVPLVFANAGTVRLFDDAFYMYRLNREGSIVSAPNIKREFDKLSTAKYFYAYHTETAYGEVLLRRRASALVFGALLSLKKYSNDEKYMSLIEKIKEYESIMSYKKYKPIVALCKMIGISNTSRVLNAIMK